MGYLEKKRDAMLNSVAKGGGRLPLPSEYQEVNYIESTSAATDRTIQRLYCD